MQDLSINVEISHSERVLASLLKDIGRLSLYAKREFVILRGRRIKNAKQEKDYEQ